MNIKINAFENQLLRNLTTKQYIFGSHLYGVNTEKSDKDILCIYQPNWDIMNKSILYGLPNIHQFQFTDVENQIDYIYTTEIQFVKNLFSGDSTINAETVLFYDDEFTNQFKDKLYCYNVIKAFLGFAKRDLKQYKEGFHKIMFAAKGLEIASKLLFSRQIRLHKIQELIFSIESKDLNDFIEVESFLRQKLNERLDNNEISRYPYFKVESNLFQKLIDSNNVKEFKYE